MIESNKLKSLDELYDIVPITTIRQDIGINYYKSRKRVENPGAYTIEECMKLAALIEVDYKIVMQIVAQDFLNKK